MAGIKREKGYRSNRQMAIDLGVDPSVLHRWLHGESSPSLDHCRLLSAATGTPLQRVWLMATIGSDGEDSRTPSLA